MDVLDGWPITALAGVFGLLFGSFANVAIHRWPRGGSVREPRESHCPSCDTPIAGRDNVPVISWLLLRGRCRTCGARISVVYPVVELTTAGVFAATAAVHGATWILPALLVLGWSLVVATAIDLEHRIIPNRLTYPLSGVMLVLVGVAAAIDGAWGDLLRAVVVGLVLPAGMLALSEVFRLLRGQAGMGMGDIKLAVSLGLALGYLGGWHVAIGLYATVIAAVLVAFTLIAAGRARLATRIPFGPYLAIGTLVAVLAGVPLREVLRTWLGFV